MCENPAVPRARDCAGTAQKAEPFLSPPLRRCSCRRVLITLDIFNQILGCFVPVTIFSLGLSAAAILRLPRPPRDAHVFHSPYHPLPIALFLLLIVSVLILFVVGEPPETLIGAAIAAAGIPVSFLLPHLRRQEP